MLVVSLNLLGITLESSLVGTYAKRLVSYYSSEEQVGKIKFVSTEEENYLEVMSMVSIDYDMPFENGVVSMNENKQIFVEGNGEVLVRCPYPSRVADIILDGTKHTVVLDCGFNINVSLIGLDNVGVKISNKLKKGDEIGIALASIIELKITHKNKPVEGLKVVDGRLCL